MQSEPEYDLPDKGNRAETCASQVKALLADELPVTIFEFFF